MPLRLALLDRDGTVNVKAPEGEYVTAPDELVLIDGVAEAIQRLNRSGVRVAVVTNQRGVARGRMSLDDLEAVHAELARRLEAAGAHLDGIFVCPHAGGSCSCRKPEPGLLVEAMAAFAVAPGDAVMIGDAPSDVEAGRRAGVATIRLAPEGDAPTLSAAVERLLAR